MSMMKKSARNARGPAHGQRIVSTDGAREHDSEKSRSHVQGFRAQAALALNPSSSLLAWLQSK